MRREGCKDGCFWTTYLQVLLPRQFALVCHSVNMEWCVKENHVAVIILYSCGKSYSQIVELLKPFKTLRMFVCPSNFMKNSGGLKTGLGQDA